MSIDKEPTNPFETNDRTGLGKQADSQGGWRIKQRKAVPERKPERSAASIPDREDALKPGSSGSRNRRPPSGSYPQAPSQTSQSPAGPRWRLLAPLLLGGVAALATFAFFWQDIQPWLNDEAQLAKPSQASTSSTDSAATYAAIDGSDLELQAIALPALESEGYLPVYFRLSRAVSWPVEIAYETAAHTADADTDFAAESGTVTIPPGDLTVELAIPLVNDDLAENAEKFRIILSIDPETARLTDPLLMAIVLDDDKGVRSDDK